jgi:hypothetical protein
MSHKVKTHNWKNGVLEIIEREFASMNEAVGFLDTDEGKYAHGIKIYNDAGELVHAINPEVETNLTPEAGYS